MFNTANKKISLILALFSAGYLLMAFRLPEYPYVPVDADAVPVALGFILLFLSVLLYFQKDNHSAGKSKIPKDEKNVILAVLGFVLLFIMLLEWLGFLITTVLFIFGNSWFLGYRNWRRMLIVSLAIPLAIYFLFNAFLKLSLPQGILPF